MTGTELQPALQDEVGRQLMRGVPKPFPVDPQVLAAYASKYQSSTGEIVTIRVDGARIFIQVPNQPESELLAHSENQYYPRQYDDEFTFYENASGEVDRLVMLQFGMAYEAKKVQ